MNNFAIVFLSAGLKNDAIELMMNYKPQIITNLSNKECQTDLLDLCNNLALFESLKGKFQRSLKILTKGEEILKNLVCCNHKNLLTVYSNMGVIYFQEKNYAQAESIFKKLFVIHQKENPGDKKNLNYEEMRPTLYYNYVRILQAAKNYADANQYLTQLLNWSEGLDVVVTDEFKLKIQKLAIQLKADTGEYDNALGHADKFFELIQDLGEAEAENEDYFVVLKAKAIILFKSGKKLEAKKAMTKLIARDKYIN